MLNVGRYILYILFFLQIFLSCNGGGSEEISEKGSARSSTSAGSDSQVDFKTQKADKYLSFEDRDRGMGLEVNFATLKTGAPVKLYATLRDADDNDYIINTKADWSNFSEYGSISIVDDHIAIFTPEVSVDKVITFETSDSEVQSKPLRLATKVIPTNFQISLPSNSITIDTPLSGEVLAVDNYGNIDETYQSDVYLYSTGDTIGEGLVDIVNGRGSFTIQNSTIEQTLLTLSGVFGSITNLSAFQKVEFQEMPASQFVITSATNVLPGDPSLITIQAQDALGRRVMSYQNDVDLVYSGTSLSGSVSVDIVNGEGSTSLSSLVAQIVNLSLANPQGGISDISSTNSFYISAANADRFIIDPVGSVTAGANVSVVIKAVDSFNNQVYAYQDDVTLSALGAISSDTVVDIVNGIATINLSTSSAGVVNLSLKNSTGAVADLSSTQSFNVLAGAATQFSIVSAADMNAGASTTINVEAQDAYGNLVTSYVDDVDLTISDGSTASYTIDIIAGVGSYTYSSNTAGTVNLSFTNSTGSISNLTNTGSFDVLTSSADRFIFSPVSDTVAGSNSFVSVRAVDQYGNTVPTYQDDVSVEATGVVVQDEIVDIVNGLGVVSFNATTSGVVNLALKNSTGAISNLTDTTSYNIIPDTAVAFVILPQADVLVNENFTITVEAQDQYGNLVPSYEDDVTLEFTGKLLEDVPLDITGGSASATRSTNQSGVVVVRVKNSVGAISDLSSAIFFNVSSGVAERFEILPLIDITAGQTQTITIRALDDNGNLVPDYEADVTLSAVGVISGDNVIDIQSGIGTINFTSNTAGSVSLSLKNSMGVITDVSATDNYTIFPDAPSKFYLGSPGAPYYKGYAYSFSVSAGDQYGNLISSYQDDVDLDYSGALIGSSSLDIVNGVATVSLTPTSVGTLNLSLSNSTGTITDLTDTLSLSIQIEPASKFSLVSAMPSSLAASGNVTVTVHALNNQNEIDTNYQNDISVRNSHGATLRFPGTSETKEDDYTCDIINGVCSVIITSNFAGSSTLTLVDSFTTGLSVVGQSSSLTWLAGSCYEYSFGEFGAETIIAGNSHVQPVYAWDSSGNICDDDSSVDIDFSGSFITDTTVNMSDGVGSYSFTPSSVGTIQANMNNSTGGITNYPVDKMFYVLDQVADEMIFVSAPSTVTAGNNNISFNIQARANSANTTKYNGDVQLSVYDVNDDNLLIDTVDVTLTNGVGAFSYSATSKTVLKFEITQTYEYSIATLPSINVSVNSGSAYQYQITQALEAGLSPSYSTVTIQVQDQFSNPVTGYNDDVSLNVTGSAVVTGGVVVNINNGQGTAQVTNTVIETVTASLYNPTGSVTNVGTSVDIEFGVSPTVEFSLDSYIGKKSGSNYAAKILLEVRKGNGDLYSDYYGEVTVNNTGTLTTYAPFACGGVKQPACPSNNFTVSISEGKGEITLYSSTIQTRTIGLTNSSHGFDVGDTASVTFVNANASKYKIISVSDASVGSPASVTVSAVDDEDFEGNVTGSVVVSVTGSAGEWQDSATSVGSNSQTVSFSNESSKTIYFGNIVSETVSVSLSSASGGPVADPFSPDLNFTAPDRFSIAAQPVGIAGEDHVITIKALDSGGDLEYNFDGELTLIHDGSGISHIKSACGSDCPSNFQVLMDQGVGRIVVSSSGAQSVNFSVSSVYSDINSSAIFNVTFDGSAQATRFFIEKPQGVAPGESASVVVRAVDQNNNTVLSYQDDVSLSSSGSATGDGVVDIVNGVGTIVISNTARETVTLSLSASSGSITDVSHTTTLSFYRKPNETCLFHPCRIRSEDVSFNSSQFLYVATNAATVSEDAHFEDFDDDGMDDVLLVRSYAADHLYLGNNGQTSNIALKFGSLNQHNRSGASVAADFNNDGYMDFAVFDGSYGSGSDARGIVFLGDGAGDFPVNAYIDAADEFAVFKALGADMDNDGDMDLVTLEGNNNAANPIAKVRVYKNDGIGNFTKSYEGTFTYNFLTDGSLSVFRYDKDNFLDISVNYGANYDLTEPSGNEDANKWNNLYLVNDGSADDFTLAENFLSLNKATDQLFFDIDNDGYLDRVSSAFASKYLILYYTTNMIHKDVVDPVLQLTSGSNSAGSKNIIMDVNGDLNPDILTCLDGANPIVSLSDDPSLKSWLSSTDLVTFQNTGSFTCRSFRVGDFDGDSITDLLFVDDNGTNIIYYGQ